MFYIGSSSVIKVLNGYHGSVGSKRYMAIWKSELEMSSYLFKTFIIKQYPTRKEALLAEYRLQVRLDVVRSNLYVNQATAVPNGFFGMECSGALSPRYGKKASLTTKAKMSASRLGIKTGLNPKKGRAGAANSMFGKNRTPEEKASISKARSLRSKEENISSYSRNKTDEERHKISEFQKENQAGAKNARAKNWEILTPNGIVKTDCLRIWCSENSVSESYLKKKSRLRQDHRGIMIMNY